MFLKPYKLCFQIINLIGQVLLQLFERWLADVAFFLVSTLIVAFYCSSSVLVYRHELTAYPHYLSVCLSVCPSCRYLRTRGSGDETTVQIQLVEEIHYSHKKASLSLCTLLVVALSCW